MTAEYIAGLIDGEGYLGIWLRKSGYQPGVKIAMVGARHVLEELQRQFGGHIEHRVAKQQNHRDSDCWSLKTKKAIVEFLDTITPHLLIKQRQAELLKEFCELGALHPLYAPIERLERSQVIFNEMRRLKWESPATTE
jgi:hypothetical protein